MKLQTDIWFQRFAKALTMKQVMKWETEYEARTDKKSYVKLKNEKKPIQNFVVFVSTRSL